MASSERARSESARRHVRPRVVTQAFIGGAVIGAVYALVARPRDEVFVTDGWSYVPADEWWLHGLLLGTLLALVYVALVVGLLLAAALIRRGVLFTVVGSLLLVMAVFFLGRAVLGDESMGGRVVWVMLGALVAAVGLPMIVTEHRWRRRRPASAPAPRRSA